MYDGTRTCMVLYGIQAFLPLLKKAASAGGSTGLCCARAAVVNFSTRMGSIDDNTSGGIYAYRSSKVCLCLVLLLFLMGFSYTCLRQY